MAVAIPVRGFIEIDIDGGIPEALLARPQAETLPPEKSCLEKVQEIAANLIIGIGILLLVISLGLFAQCIMGGICLQDLTITQTLFTSGLSAILAGWTLRQGGYKGELQFSDSRLPFKYTVSQK